uniref:Uncharacterized protein n=1 Tax=Knipowitschia caucasica TaxID=637954 RepID=A0AAV2J3Z8_KNICA
MGSLWSTPDCPHRYDRMCAQLEALPFSCCPWSDGRRVLGWECSEEMAEDRVDVLDGVKRSLLTKLWRNASLCCDAPCAPLAQ